MTKIDIGAGGIMLALPVEVFPRLLSTPACVVAVRLTCKSCYSAIPPNLFKLAAKLSWASDYWTLITSIDTGVTVFSRVQNCACVQNCTCVHVAGPSLPRMRLQDSHYLWMFITGDTSFSITGMTYHYGIIHVENPANIFRFVSKRDGVGGSIDELAQLLPSFIYIDFDMFVCIQEDTGKWRYFRGYFTQKEHFDKYDGSVVIFRRGVPAARTTDTLFTAWS